VATEKEILVNQKVYPLDVVFGAAFVYLDKCYVFIDKGEKNQWKVRLRGKPGCSAKEFQALVGEFENELLNQALRAHIAEKTRKVRDLIVHRALFSALPASDDLGLDDEVGDYLDDPLGIAIPWEEKFGKEEGSPEQADKKEGPGEEEPS
jgi:His-Xaa-Ser system protein HxsD